MAIHMESQGFTEHDWKLFRSRIAVWQDRYMNKLNNEYVELLCGEGAPSEKFWAFEKRIRDDKRAAVGKIQGAFDVEDSPLFAQKQAGVFTMTFTVEQLEAMLEEARKNPASSK